VKEVRAEIIGIESPAQGYCLMTLRAPEVAEASRPGQFIHVQTADGPHPILRRPFSIMSAGGGHLEILFRVVGEGTGLLAAKRPGGAVSLFGPIGTPFPDDDGVAVLIAGGIGVAPLIFLAEELKAKGTPAVFVYGARNAGDILLKTRIEQIAREALFATEDGSLGMKGFVTQAAAGYLNRNFRIYACGPEPMLEAVIRMAASMGVHAWLSLENRMACGTGACQGCVVQTRSGYRRVCVDGPVFSAGDLIGEAEVKPDA